MARSPTTLTKLKLGKLKVVRRQLLQRYEHQPFISCLAGFYGCQWKRYQRARSQPGECCCSKLECSCFTVLIISFFLSLVFLYFWSQAQNDYDNFDWFSYGSSGFWFPWSLLLFVLAIVLFSYVALLLVLAVCLLSEGQRLYLHWSHKVGVVVTLGVSVAAIAVFSDRWNEEWTTLLLSFQVTAPYLQIGGVAVMTLISWPVAMHVSRMNKKVYQGLTMAIYFSVLLTLFLLPLGLYSSCIKEEKSFGMKPLLIGHRGAPMLAPENTRMSFEKAIKLEADGLETDVTISYDGEPFLMHDKNLKRTTNVAQIFPNHSSLPAAFFNWSELETLNAGAWFIANDPFGTKSLLSDEDQRLAENQSICRLIDFLHLAGSNKKLVIFDLYRPPSGHPYRDSWINRTLEVINESSIDPSLILWLPQEQRSMVQSLVPEFQQTSGQQDSIEQLKEDHIVMLNLPYSEMSAEQIGEYAASNITTNLYVVNQQWLYSLAWCAGTHSVTTNAVQGLINLQRPLFLMTFQEYSMMWILTDALSAVLVTLVFTFHWWRERGLPCCTGRSRTHETGPYSKFRTELSDVWSVFNVSEARSTPTSSDLPTIYETPEVPA
uniref:Glycerophosphodiester phosphodiesterase domain containing 4 n=1 Tax=Erpetoichthys calabaricus TaxID=27687 RepID=A0A8C4RKF5_ERPCA